MPCRVPLAEPQTQALLSAGGIWALVLVFGWGGQSGSKSSSWARRLYFARGGAGWRQEYTGAMSSSSNCKQKGTADPRFMAAKKTSGILCPPPMGGAITGWETILVSSHWAITFWWTLEVGGVLKGGGWEGFLQVYCTLQIMMG